MPEKDQIPLNELLDERRLFKPASRFERNRQNFNIESRNLRKIFILEIYSLKKPYGSRHNLFFARMEERGQNGA
jgi:hypothetical protein